MENPESDFYVIAREPGAEHPAIPTWACHGSNPAQLAADHGGVTSRCAVESVPGAFQLLDVLAEDECERLVELTESMGYLEDAAVSLPRSIRHNHNTTWVADDESCELIWERCQPLMQDDENIFQGKQALGINARFRFYRYGPGDYFAPHTDGSWPGSRAVDGELVANAYDDRWSQLSLLLFLSEDYSGGETQFFVSQNDPTQPARLNNDVAIVDVRTPRGGALCFPHGTHPLHCMHASTEITAGYKYIIRSDILFEL